MPSIHRRSNSPNWHCDYYLPDGRRTLRSTGTADKQKAMAICLKYAEASRDAAAGRFTESRARAVLADIYETGNRETLPVATSKEYMEGWVTKKALELADRSLDEYTRVVQAFLKYLGSKAKKPMDMVAPRDVSAYRAKLAKDVAGGTVNKALRILRSCWSDAVREGIIRDNVFSRVRFVKETRGKRKPFSLAQLKRVLRACNDEWRGMVLFGFYTGQRLQDISLLTWENVDMEHEEVRLVTGKTKRPMTIPIPRPFLAYLLQLDAPDDPKAFLFPKAAPAPSTTLSRQFTDMLGTIGLREKRDHKGKGKGRDAKRDSHPLSFHSIRHTATSMLKNAGVSNAVAMELIGHDSEAVSRVYTHIETSALKKAVETLPDVVPGLKQTRKGRTHKRRQAKA